MPKQDDKQPCIMAGCNGEMTYHEKLDVDPQADQPVGRADGSAGVQTGTIQDGNVTLILVMSTGTTLAGDARSSPRTVTGCLVSLSNVTA